MKKKKKDSWSKEQRAAYNKEYRNNPVNKAAFKIYSENYNKKPEVKKRMNEKMKVFRNSKKGKEYFRLYQIKYRNTKNYLEYMAGYYAKKLIDLKKKQKK